MSTNEPSKSLQNTWKILTQNLENGQLPENPSVLQRFLYESISFVAGFKDVGEEGSKSALDSWLEIVTQLLPLMVNHHTAWHEKGLNYSTVLVYLNHLTFHLVDTKIHCFPTFKLLACGMFSLLSACLSSTEPQQPNLVPDVTHKTYALLCNFSQRLQQTDLVAYTGVRQCYELYLLASAVLNLDSTNRNRNGLRATQDFFIRLRQLTAERGSAGVLPSGSTLSESGKKCSSPMNDDLDDRVFLSELICVGVRAFTAQSRDLSGDASIMYLMELFRLTKWIPELSSKLFLCGGNLFKYKLDRPLLTFSDASFELVREQNHEKSVETHSAQDLKVKEIVLSCMQLAQILNETVCSEKKDAALLEEDLSKFGHFSRVEEQLSLLLSETQKPVRPVVSDALSIVLKELPASEPAQRWMALGARRLCHSLASFAVRVLARDVLGYAGKADQVSMMQRKVYDLALACKARVILVQALVQQVQDDLEEVANIAAHLKPCLSALTLLVNRVNQKGLIDPSSCYHRQVHKCLEAAMLSVGSMGRNLRRQEQHAAALALLSPLWPVANVSELIPLVSHHESLASCLRETGQIDRALIVVKESAALNASLLTEPLLRTLSKLVDLRPNLAILSIFEPCVSDATTYVHMVGNMARVLLSGQQTKGQQQHCESLLEALLKDASLSVTEKAVYKFLLAEHLWFSMSSSILGDSSSIQSALQWYCGRPFNLAREAMLDLLAAENEDKDDFLAQTSLLVWEILNKASCLQVVANSTPSQESSCQSPQEKTKISLEPADTQVRQYCSTKVEGLADLGFSLTAIKSTKALVPQKKSSKQKIIEEEKEMVCPNQVDADLLMQKAKLCIAVWISWFKCHCQNVGKGLAEQLDLFRVDKSLGFLSRVAELAIVCHQPLTAVEALCQARTLSMKYGKPETTKRVTGSIISTLTHFGFVLNIPQSSPDLKFGMQQKPKNSKEKDKSEKRNCAIFIDDGATGEKDGLSSEDKMVLEQLDLDVKCHILQLVSVAAHYLKTKQDDRFLSLRRYIIARVADLRRKGPLTPNATLSLSILHRLTAEFSRSPMSAGVKTRCEASSGEDFYPLENGSDALKYITCVASFYLGESFKNMNRGTSVEMWRLIHEYLATLRLKGELYIHVGNLKYARTYLTEGLKVARSCLLLTWTCIFLGLLAKVSLELMDANGETHHLIAQGQLSLAAHKQCISCANIPETHPSGSVNRENVKAVPKQSFPRKKPRIGLDDCLCGVDTEASCVREQLAQFPTDIQHLAWSEINPKWQQSSSTTGDATSGVSQLSEEADTSSGQAVSSQAAEKQKLSPPSKEELCAILTDGVERMNEPDCCDMCLQSEMSQARARLLCVRAELCDREGLDSSVSDQCFQLAQSAAFKCSEAASALQNRVQAALCHGGLGHLPLQYRCQNTGKLTGLSVLASQAEARFKMACRDAENCDPEVGSETKSINDIVSSLNQVEKDAAQMYDHIGSGIIRGQVYLMKAHMNYLPLLLKSQHSSAEDEENDCAVKDSSKDEDIIRLAVKDALSTKLGWDNSMLIRLKRTISSDEGKKGATGIKQTSGIHGKTCSARSNFSAKRPKGQSIKIFNDGMSTTPVCTSSYSSSRHLDTSSKTSRVTGRNAACLTSVKRRPRRDTTQNVKKHLFNQAGESAAVLESVSEMKDSEATCKVESLSPLSAQLKMLNIGDSEGSDSCASMETGYVKFRDAHDRGSASVSSGGDDSFVKPPSVSVASVKGVRSRGTEKLLKSQKENVTISSDKAIKSTSNQINLHKTSKVRSSLLKDKKENEKLKEDEGSAKRDISSKVSQERIKRGRCVASSRKAGSKEATSMSPENARLGYEIDEVSTKVESPNFVLQDLTLSPILSSDISVEDNQLIESSPTNEGVGSIFMRTTLCQTPSMQNNSFSDSISNTDLEDTKGILSGNLSVRLSPVHMSPMEIPRGRPQRKKTEAKTVSSKAKCQNSPTEDKSFQNFEESSDDKENIQGTPESYAGRKHPLITPKSNVKPTRQTERDQNSKSLMVRKVPTNSVDQDSVQNSNITNGRAILQRSQIDRVSFTDSEESPEVLVVTKRKTGRVCRNRAVTKGKSLSRASKKCGEEPEIGEVESSEVASFSSSSSPRKRHSGENIDSVGEPITQAGKRGKGGVQQPAKDSQKTTGRVARGRPQKTKPTSPVSPDLKHPQEQELDDIETDSFVVEVEEKSAVEIDISIEHDSGVLQSHSDKENNCSYDSYNNILQQFPCIALGCKDADLTLNLQQALCGLQHFPPSFLYGQLHRSLALAQWQLAMLRGSMDSKCQTSVASHLTASMHTTYRHIITRNLRTKLRKIQKEDGKVGKTVTAAEDECSDEEWMGEEQLENEKDKLRGALREINFSRPEHQRFAQGLKALPPSYTVVQLSVVDLDPMRSTVGQSQMFVTRLTSDQQPITVGIPYRRNAQLQRALRVFDRVVKLDEAYSSVDQYWTQRYSADEDLKNAVQYIQLCFLQSHLWLMLGRVAELRESEAARLALQQAAVTAVHAAQSVDTDQTFDKDIVMVLLEILLFANEEDMQTLVSCMWSGSAVGAIVQSFLQTQESLLSADQESSHGERFALTDWRGQQRGPVILILDKTLTRLPWESMPAMLEQTVTRVPSFASLQMLLHLHNERVAAPVCQGVDRHEAVAVVDPDSNLQFSRSFLLPQFQQYRGWTCLSQKPPTVSDLKAILTEHSLYLYIGHGWGKQFVGGDDLQMFRGRAVAVLMGCHSNKLEFTSQTDGDGAPLYFLLAGCPAVLGNLWVVTDKDIDKLTSHMVNQWMSSSAPVSLTATLNRARGACKLTGLNGFAPVVYGLPVCLIDKGTKPPSIRLF